MSSSKHLDFRQKENSNALMWFEIRVDVHFRADSKSIRKYDHESNGLKYNLNCIRFYVKMIVISHFSLSRNKQIHSKPNNRETRDRINQREEKQFCWQYYELWSTLFFSFNSSFFVHWSQCLNK